MITAADVTDALHWKLGTIDLSELTEEDAKTVVAQGVGNFVKSLEEDYPEFHRRLFYLMGW